MGGTGLDVSSAWWTDTQYIREWNARSLLGCMCRYLFLKESFESGPENLRGGRLRNVNF